MLNKSQRVITIFLLFEMYKNDNIVTTPFYSIILKQILAYNEKLQSRAELKILSEYMLSIPRVRLLLN